jgi:hypothetical protein
VTARNLHLCTGAFLQSKQRTKLRCCYELPVCTLPRLVQLHEMKVVCVLRAHAESMHKVFVVFVPNFFVPSLGGSISDWWVQPIPIDRAYLCGQHDHATLELIDAITLSTTQCHSVLGYLNLFMLITYYQQVVSLSIKKLKQQHGHCRKAMQKYVRCFLHNYHRISAVDFKSKQGIF